MAEVTSVEEQDTITLGQENQSSEDKSTKNEEYGNQKNAECLPSKVLDKDFIYMPGGFENFEQTEQWKSGGKWLLYSHGDLQKLDLWWIQLQPLLADGTLIGLKSSTATDSTNGVIVCYTSKCEDKQDVKAAIDAIRNVVKEQHLLYYKTNEASDSGLYRSRGKYSIALYMNSVAGSLYERDEFNRWKKDS